ncbi:MAG: type II secretion system F family protein [Acidimicrobiales bacterium]
MTGAIAPVTGVVVALLVMGVALPHCGRPARTPPVSARPSVARTGPLEQLGRAVATRAGTAASPAMARRIGRTVVAGAVAAVVAPPLALLVVGGTWLRARTASVQARRARARQVAAQLPDAVDLLQLCNGAGLSLPLAHDRIAGRMPAPVGEALRRARAAAAGGRPRADALQECLAPLGDRALALAQVLADHLRYGTPLGPALERLSLELRLDRRRRAELEVRKVPVRLLGPLVTCILPAFALLTVVPLLVVSLQSLPT